MNAITKRVLFEVLTWLDHLFPGWSQQHEERYDYLTDESRKFWLTRIGREGQR